VKKRPYYQIVDSNKPPIEVRVHSRDRSLNARWIGLEGSVGEFEFGDF
jgi:hypothetical protein